MIRLGWNTIILHRRAVTGVDEYGNDVHGTVDITITGCSVQPRVTQSATAEDNVGRVQVISGLTLLAPADPIITSSDVVEFDGRRYEADGDPAVWRMPNGMVAYQQVALRRVTG